MTNTSKIDPRKILLWLFSWQGLAVYALIFGISILFVKAYFSFLPLYSAEGKLRLSDFYVFWAASQIMQEQGILAAFDLELLNAKLRLHFEPRPDLWAIEGGFGLFWLYPPTIVPFVYPIGYLDAMPALAVFLVISLGLWIYTVKRYYVAPEGLSILPVLFAPTVFVNLAFEQNGIFTAFLLIGFIYAVKDQRNPWVIGVFAMLMLIKPHFGVLMPIVLLLEKNYKAFGACAVLCCFYLGLVTYAFGIEYWIAFLERQEFLSVFINRGEYARFSTTAFGFFLIAGIPHQITYVLHAIFVIGLIGGFLYVWRTQIWELRISMFLLVTFLIPHYSAVYDFTASAFVFGLIYPFALKYKFGKALMILFWVTPMFFNSAPNLLGYLEMPIVNVMMIIFICYIAKHNMPPKAAAKAA